MSDDLRALEDMERAAEQKLTETLCPLLDITAWLLGYAPTVIQFTKRKTLHLPTLVQHMLLKQAMASLRATSQLLIRGYSSQAATIASGLYEIYLYSSYMLDDPAKAEQFLKHSNSQDFVWRPNEMIRHIAQKRLEQQGKNRDKAALKSAIEDINGAYIYLCSLKHSNPIPLRHVVAARVDEAGLGEGQSQFAVLPDTRPEDNIVKIVILAEANMGTFLVTSNAANTAEGISLELVNWLRRLSQVQAQHVNIFNQLGDEFGPMPFPTIRK
jgi:hypothetical protein